MFYAGGREEGCVGWVGEGVSLGFFGLIFGLDWFWGEEEEGGGRGGGKLGFIEGG